MEMREKLKKILEYIDGVCPSGLSCYNCQHKDVEEGCSILAKVDYLIANGEEIPVRCKDCKYAYINSFSAASGVALCKKLSNEAETAVMQQDDFCSYGERREGE